MPETELIHKELAYRVVGCAMEVHWELGYGFLEKVYENAMRVLLQKEGIQLGLLVNFGPRKLEYKRFVK